MLTEQLKTGESVDVLFDECKGVSTVLEASGTGHLLLTAPLCRGQTVCIPEPKLMHIVYFRQSGMLSFMAQFLRMQEHDGLLCMELEMKSPISQYQRRDFVRLETSLNVLARLVATGEHVARRTTADAIRLLLSAPAHKAPRPMLRDEMIYACMTTDISGGGAKFYTRHTFEERSLLECGFSLKNGNTLYLDGVVLRCIPVQAKDYQYLVTLHFVNVDERTRRRLIQYIFEQRDKAGQAM